MKLKMLGIMAALWFSASAGAETEWIHRTLMGNTIAAPKCAAKNDAIASAEHANNVKEFAKRFCATQGYGWALAEVKNNGKTVCHACESGQGASTFVCRVEDIVADCRRIRPGSVGMLPGQG